MSSSSLSRVENNKLKNLYYDHNHPAGYGSIERLSKYSNIDKDRVKIWLEAQPIYSLFKPFRKSKHSTHYVPVIAYGSNQYHQADLVDISRLAKWNDRIRYLLTVIDVFSKKAFVAPLKNKFGKTVMVALQHIYKDKINIPKYLHTDAGKEFKNQYVQDFLKLKKIKFRVTTSPYKAAICERFNRTIQMKLYRFLRYKKTKRYLPFLQNIVRAYNETIHTAHGMKPNKISSNDFHHVFSRLYDNRVRRGHQFKAHFKVGDNCRIFQGQKLFRKGYMPNFSDEIYCIFSVDLNSKPVTYRLVNDDGELIPGKFYANELSRYRQKYIYLA